MAAEVIGREGELGSIEAFLARAEDGPSALVLSGEAGIGKSTLVRQLEPEVRVRAGLLVVGRSSESTVKTPFGPWIEILTSIQRQSPVTGGAWTALARIVPALGDGTRTDDPPPGGNRTNHCRSGRYTDG